MGKFKDLEIPDLEPDHGSLVTENLTLFVEAVATLSAGYTKTPRYLADVKSMLELLNFKLKAQRTKNPEHTRNHTYKQAG